jgi:predicted permease
MSFAMRLYRLLAQAFPHEFKIVYGAEVIQLGEDVVEGIARRHGFWGLVRMIANLAVRIPIEYLSEMRRDLVYALRTVSKSPGFAIVAVVSLGLGIGCASLMYSEIHALFFRDLPLVKQPEQLVTTGASYPYFEQCSKYRDLFSGVAAYVPAVPFSVAFDSNPGAKSDRIYGQIVSPEYFQVLGVPAARGRVFSPAIDRPGQALVVIVTDRFWRERLNSDPGVVGKTFRLNGQRATIVGITPKDFTGAMAVFASDVFVPTTAPPKTAPELREDILRNRDAKAFMLLMRLAPGVTMTSAEAALDTITKRLEATNLDPARDRKERRLKLSAGGTAAPAPPEIRAVVYCVYGTLIGLILTIACMNLANMLLARAGARQREVAIRLAVGASRFRLIRQLLTESILLSICGGALGIAFAYWMAGVISKMKFPGLTVLQFDLRPDWQVIGVTFVLSLITGTAFGLAPAFAATRTAIPLTLKEGGITQMRGYRRFGMRNVIMVFQVSGSVMLLLITTFISLGSRTLWMVDASFDTRTMYLVSLDPVRDGYSPEQAITFFEKLPDRMRNVSAVEGAALTVASPFDTELAPLDFTAPTSAEESQTTLRIASKQVIGPGYFATLKENMLAGREFIDPDQRIDPSHPSAIPAILNQAAAHELFGSQNPIGRHISQPPQSYEIIGVVRDLKGPSLKGRAQTTIYLPITVDTMARPQARGLTLMVRSSAGADALEGIRREIASLDPNLTIFNVRTLSQSLDDMNSLRRYGTFLYGSIGLFGLILASVGLAGVTAFAVTQRRKEIGIRMALGAQKAQVLRLVLREGAVLVLIGSVLGLVGTMVVVRAMAATLNVLAQTFQDSAGNARLMVEVPLLLAGLAMLACYLPARRATQIDPLKALREE